MITTSIPANLDSIICSNFSNVYSYHKRNTIKNIFLDNYYYMKQLHSSAKLLDSTLKEVQMMLLCSTHFLGYSLYECPDCGEQLAIHISCHSRFFNSCSAKYARQRANHVSSICLDVKHRQMVKESLLLLKF